MSILASLSDVKLAFNVSGTADDALLGHYLTGASDFVERQTGQKFSTGSYTDTFDGDGTRAYAMKYGPIISVQSASIDGVPVVARADLTSSGFVQDGPLLRLTDDLKFNPGFMNCQVVYTAGVTPVPQDVQQAVIELVGLKYKERNRIGLNTIGMAGESFTTLPSQVPISVQRVIDAYRRIWW